MPKDNRLNKQYSQEYKETILKRVDPPICEPIYKISEETGIPKSTIRQWVVSRNKKQSAKPMEKKSSSKWSSEDKFHIVLETYPLTEEELAEYCRKKGLFVSDIKAWREQCIKANMGILKDSDKLEADLNEERKKTKFLEKDLRIKEKALAETAALLVLQKKARAIWGDLEDE